MSRISAGASTRAPIALKPLSLCVALAFPALATAQQAATTLPEVRVQSESPKDTTENTGQYSTSGKSSAATPLGLSLRDTPQSVSVITQQRMQDQGMTTITDVVNNATGLSVNQYETNRGQFTARGFDISTLMIDGVPTSWEQPWSSGEIMTSLALYDRVELVRGATGLTSGAGDPSAAINMVRKRAHSKVFQGTAELEVGSWSQRRAMVDISSPLNQAKTLRARVVAEAGNSDSWVRLLGNDATTVYATAEADLGPRTLLSAGFSRQTTETRSPMWGGLPTWYADGSVAHWDRATTTASRWTRWDSTYDNLFAALNHQFDNGWKLRASYSHGKRSADSYLLYLFGAPNRTTGLGLSAMSGSYQVATTQDDLALQTNGSIDWMGRKHELAMGLSHSKQKFRADNRTAPMGTAGNFNQWDGSYPEPQWGPLAYYGDGLITQNAAYAVARFHVADPLRIVTGVRLTNFSRSGDEARTEPFSLSYKNELTPYAGVLYDVNDALSAYASYTSIFKPQKLRDLQGNYLDPVVGKSTEIGLKGEFFDGRLQTSAAVFHIQQSHLGQTTGQIIAGTVPPEPAYRAADGATSRGFELEATGEVSKGWNLTAGYTQFKATDVAGADVNSVYPRKLIKAFSSYRLPGAASAWTLGAGVTWQSSTYANARNPQGKPQRIAQDAYALVNLMVRYDVSEQLALQFNVNNLLDKTHYGMFSGYSQITYGAPRNATLALRYKF